MTTTNISKLDSHIEELRKEILLLEANRENIENIIRKELPAARKQILVILNKLFSIDSGGQAEEDYIESLRSCLEEGKEQGIPLLLIRQVLPDQKKLAAARTQLAALGVLREETKGNSVTLHLKNPPLSEDAGE